VTENGPREHQQEAEARGWGRCDALALAAVTLLAGILRFVRLGDPATLVFDETYYAADGCWYVKASESICGVGAEQTPVHPPLGKWLIGLGVDLFGYDSFGWRVASALAGVVAVALLFVLARKLLNSTVAGLLAGGLLALDPLHLVQSRIAMLDIFVTLFTLFAFTAIVFDRDRSRREIRGMRPWRLAAGISAGLAASAKWSGLFAVAGIVALTIVWEVADRRDDAPRPLRRALAEEGPTIVGWLVIVPLLTYVLTFAGRFEGSILQAPWSDGSWWRAWWDRQHYMFSTSRTLSSDHPYQSPPWSWPLLKRAVSYYFQTPDDRYAEILGTGNPFVWWTSMLALIPVGVAWIRGRGALVRRPEGFILAAVAWTYLPWFVAVGDRSAVFLFYFLPVLPFLFLGPAYLASRIGASWEARATIGLYAATAVAALAFLYPVLTKVPLDEDAWRARIWLFDDCDKAADAPTTTTVTETEGDETNVRTSVSRPSDSLPPEGWCWI
jgi:dolichyl-phosphate-mannose--protein O-mannosyl transferase